MSEPLCPICMAPLYAHASPCTDVKPTSSPKFDERAANERTFQMFANQGPHREPRCCANHYADEMTKREFIASTALNGLLANPAIEHRDLTAHEIATDYAEAAVRVADALLKELAK